MIATPETRDRPRTPVPHALVVGGTGMLRGLTLSLVREGYTVSVVARNRERLRVLAAEAAKAAKAAKAATPGSVNPLPVDYRDGDALQGALQSAVTVHGPVILAICWIHSTAPAALEAVAEIIDAGPSTCRLFHVRGSAAANPTAKARDIPAWLCRYPRIRYRQVILGFVIEGGRSRWLTHQEISDGVLKAVHQDAAWSVVGTVEPWSMRP